MKQTVIAAAKGKSKTMNFAAVLAIFGAAQANLSVVQDFIDPQLYGWITFGIAIAVGVLRAITTKAISEK